MYCNKETYDIVGMELTIVKSSSGYYAMVQEAEGELGIPTIAKLTVKGRRIEFSTLGPAHDSMPPRKFVGNIREDGIEGIWVEAGIAERLTKGKSFWEKAK